MYHMLLVDDELYDLRRLDTLLEWEALGLSVIACADGGDEALEVLRAESVDIMITDINMQPVSGIELARQAMELQPGLRVVFISGNGDFGQAQQAIALNASGYLLKPVSEDELARTLGGVKQSLDRERACSQLERYYEDAEPLLRRELFVQLLEGSREADTAVSLLRRSGLPWDSTRLYAALLSPDELFRQLDSCGEEAPAQLERRLEEAVERYCAAERVQSCRLGRLEYALILQEEYDSGRLERLIGMAAEATSSSVTIGVGPVVPRLEELHISFRKAKAALELKLFLGTGKVIAYTADTEAMAERTDNLDQILQALFQAIAAYRLVEVDDCIEQLFVTVGRLRNKLDIFQLFLHIVERLDAYLHTLHEDFFVLLSLDRRQLHILYHFETTREMKSWLRRRMFELSEHLRQKRHSRKRRLVEEMQAYVEARLGETLLLREAARHFSFSPNHLGQIFYEETGIYFSDYVSRRRLERVKQLLADPKLKIYEAAEQAGYKNLSHFGKQFKAYFGITPGEYRRRL
ncbi:helix-turn-helix domain-containing protein [Paenibacillus tengchongensis]|uniref:helix-turn-helix domain-containing protein n=1 Tax=Paenibacillus tengchongensis TaxID=2608684 RepID=UPI00124BD6E3|nr:helix-turn-helix domain-containing protein [Paenibacillus tengchongensis]